jgi:ferric-dicitrate binding protein FerR (iron transport regulator)
MVADTVETAANARLQLRLTDGAVINISPGSGLRISQYSFSKNILRRSAMINLLHGSARFFVQNPGKILVAKSAQSQQTEGSRFSIETGQAIIEAWEADVVVEASSEKSSVCSLAGSVNVRNRSNLIIGNVSVGENLTSVVRPKEPPTVPSILTQQQRRVYTKDARQF